MVSKASTTSRASVPLQDPPSNPTPDIVILDLEMPVVDGFGVLEWVRENLEPCAHSPSSCLRPPSNPDHEVRARELGATEVHQKPTDLAGLGGGGEEDRDALDRPRRHHGRAHAVIRMKRRAPSWPHRCRPGHHLCRMPSRRHGSAEEEAHDGEG